METPNGEAGWDLGWLHYSVRPDSHKHEVGGSVGETRKTSAYWSGSRRSATAAMKSPGSGYVVTDTIYYPKQSVGSETRTCH